MASRQRDAVRGCMIAQRAGPIVVELEVVGGDLDILPAQVFGAVDISFISTVSNSGSGALPAQRGYCL